MKITPQRWCYNAHLVSLFNEGSITFVCISLTIWVSCFHILYVYFSICESCLGELFNDPNLALSFFKLFSLSWWLWMVYPQGEDQWLGYILWPFFVSFLGKLISHCICCHKMVSPQGEDWLLVLLDGLIIKGRINVYGSWSVPQNFHEWLSWRRFCWGRQWCSRIEGTHRALRVTTSMLTFTNCIGILLNFCPMSNTSFMFYFFYLYTLPPPLIACLWYRKTYTIVLLEPCMGPLSVEWAWHGHMYLWGSIYLSILLSSKLHRNILLVLYYPW